MIESKVRYDWKNLKPYIKKVEASNRKSLLEVGRFLIKEIKDIFPKSGSGRFYYWRGGIIQSSAPGEPPIIRTGRLKDSISANASWSKMSRITFSLDGGTPHEFNDGVGRPKDILNRDTIVVGTNVPYADDLEWGGKVFDIASVRAGISSARLLPRPWLTPSYGKAKLKLFTVWANNIKGLLA